MEVASENSNICKIFFRKSKRKNIDDQIRVCKNYIQNHNMIFEDKHIYIDEAISGSIINRPGLQALESAAENKEFDAVALRDTLNKNTVSSSLALKELLGSISLEPVIDKKSDFFYIVSSGEIKFKPYYIAHTKIQTLALLDDKYKSSNWLHWRRGRDSNPRGELTPA